MDVLLTNKEIEFAIDKGDNEFGYWLQVYNIQTGARLKRGKRPVKEDFTSAAIAKAQLKKAVRWLETKVEENFVVYAHETTVVEDRVALPIEDWWELKEAASG